MKKNIVRIFALILALSLCFTFTGCELLNNLLNPKPTLSTEVYEGDTIWVGNTAGTTGALAAIGGPFNLGIQAAFAEYNAKGGFNGRNVALKHHDDGGVGTEAATLTEKLVHEDKVFAIVGNFGSYAVSTNLDILKDNCVPMIYAAAGNEVLLNENAVDDSDRAIFPVQPLNHTEGRSLIVRAFASPLSGGLGATKVGVISNSNEASQAMLAGIKAEAENLPASKKNNIVYQNVATDDFSAAINALKDAGCDVVIVTVIGADWTTTVAKMVDAGCTWSVLTSYNNASASVFNNTEFKYADPTTGEEKTAMIMSSTYATALATMKIYSQGWINITDVNSVYAPDYEYRYKGFLAAFYALNPLMYTADDPATPDVVDPYVKGFTEDYWKVAEALYTYAYAESQDILYAFSMSYDAYALAGYIAGNIFCQALEALETSGKELTRANLVDVMETTKFKIPMAGTITFADGMRAGVDAFSLTVFYAANGAAGSTSVTNGVSSLDDLRKGISE